MTSLIQTDITEIEKTDYWDYERGYTIYSLVNLDNGKRYIGRTKNLRERLHQHFLDLNIGKHKNKALNKDCKCRFGFEILERKVSFVQRTDKERQYMIWYRTYDERYGYNLNDPCLKTFLKNEDTQHEG